jgi:hypothetical protein
VEILCDTSAHDVDLLSKNTKTVKQSVEALLNGRYGVGVEAYVDASSSKYRTNPLTKR